MEAWQRRLVWIVGLGVLVRLLQPNGTRPIWLDEAVTLIAARAVDPIAAAINTDLHPPLLVMLIRLWGGLGDGEAWLRLPSLAASIATIPVAFVAGRRHRDAELGLSVALLAALAPPAVLYAGECRPYALGLLLATWWIAELARPDPLRLGLCAVIAVSTQYGLWVLIGATTGWSLLGGTWGRRHLLALLPAAVLAGVIGRCCLLPQLRGPGSGVTEGALEPWFWTGWGGAWAAAAWTLELTGWWLSGLRGPPGLGLGAALVVTLAWGGGRDRLGAVGLLCATLAVFWGAAGLGLHPYGPIRQLMVAGPLLGLVVADRLGTRVWAVAIVAGLGLLLQPALPWHDARCAIGRVGSEEEVWVHPLLGPPLAWYAPGREVRTLPWRVQGQLPPAPSSLWLMMPVDKPDLVVRSWLAEEGLEADLDERCPGVRLTHYRRYAMLQRSP